MGTTVRIQYSPTTVNYAFRKTIAALFLDIGLLLSNIALLKLISEIRDTYQPKKTAIGLISISITVQVSVGVILVLLGYRESALATRSDSPEVDADVDHEGLRSADRVSITSMYKTTKFNSRLNSIALCCIFCILIINVVISGICLGIPSFDGENNSDAIEGMKTTMKTVLKSTLTPNTNSGSS
ncbi:hypothetical protein CHS0354_039111 [Potamilus streckersoni]|uniref:Uncharacterized protein n=1 Tax=Potamilus streckersoni TaxID=2493646 RepID=A0AAE0TJE5_9BIVA|nr:hypothetical protein CHS0354_039111 [Potamilus streckersoni]